ncbi:gamma-glutamyl phosphate reductase [Terasakiella brassicae]|uniref:Gamma-glutamyl phosphate reductase n=1 Tax=Terasakiella brassicae TaxID=1634917 RepID=A0A917FAV6_9PROT|nr:glutamate-5-semialdehyde dehydrogenase [Terasakiella brassicae]GGF63350.1 gamma-glutamyl phosphate reductase [Terasakiella brassicae]
MTAQEAQDIKAMMTDLGQNAKAAALELSVAPTEQKNDALLKAAALLRSHTDKIKQANAKDMAAGEQKGLSSSLLDRLMLDDARVEAMAKGLEAIAQLPDPVGEVMSQWDRPNGLNIARVRVPLGVIGIIYESRPNVTADAGALSLKSGNVAILRGGSESFHSSHAIMDCLVEALEQAGLPKTCIQMIPTTDRAAVGEMLTMSDVIDVIVPRGGKGLIERITRESKIPLFKHLDGICHIYVDEAADLEKARKVVVNGKMRRTGICGATETLLVNRAVVDSHLGAIVNDLIEAGCQLRGDAEACAVDSRITPATEEDWGTEYLDAILSIKVVGDVNEAVNHINTYGSHHTDCIITEDGATAENFLNRVDSAICVLNASTQFADGGEFGMGAEIGISTGKMHARGPVGVEQLTSFKYKVRGDGQCRP